MVIRIRANIIIMVAITLSSISPSSYHNLVIVMIITMTMIIVMTMIIMIIIVSIQFATDHRLLVEPACGAVLASIYRSFYHHCSSDYDLDWDYWK